MSCARGKRESLHAFTLLEIMLAVVILAMIGLAIYEFVQVNLRAVAAAKEASVQDAQVRGLFGMLQSQMNNLESSGTTNTLSGVAHIFHNAASDELTWLAVAGNGLMTKDATGEYLVTLMLRPATSSTNNALELGLRRVPTYARQLAAAQNAVRTGNTQQLDSAGDWVHLLDNVAAIEFRYFQTANTDPVQNWTTANLPMAVQVRLWRNIDDDPFVAVLNLPLKQNPP